jgi:hypothetical protein
MRTIRKGLGEEIIEGFDWSDHLADGDEIAESQWTLDFGISVGISTFDKTSTQLEIIGGDLNTQYKCQNQITTNDGFVYQKSFKVMVVER